MKHFLLFIIGFWGFSTYAQNLEQISSNDLELQFSETVVKHGNDWYFGTGGGVFKTSNNGQLWTEANTDLYSLLGELRVEDFLSNSGTLIGFNRWNGVISTSNGNFWVDATTGLPDNFEIMSRAVVIGDRILLAVDDNNGVDNEYAIYYTDNNGGNWQKGAVGDGWFEIYGGPDTAYVVVDNSFVGKTVDGITIDPNTFEAAYPGNSISKVFMLSDTLYVVGDGEFYRYNFEGKNWIDVGPNITNGIGFITVIESDNDSLYASVLGQNGLELVKSADGGNTWRDITPTIDMGLPFFLGGYASGNELMLCFIDAGMYYSPDGGDTFNKVGNGALATDFEELVAVGNNLMTSLFISGVYLSTDNGITWNASTNGLPSEEMLKHLYGFQVFDDVVYANFTTNPDENPDPDKVFFSTDGGLNWTELTMPEGMSNLRLDGVSGTTLFFDSYDGDVIKYFRMEKGTSTYTELTSLLPAGIKPVAISGDGTTLFMTGYDSESVIKIYQSSNKGDSWSLAMDGINTENLEIYNDNSWYFLITPEPGKAFTQINYKDWNRVLARWNGSQWVEVTANGLPYIDLNYIDYHNGYLYVSKWNDVLYVSSDDGDNFNEYPGLPQGLNVNDVAFLGSDLYVTTDKGIWKGSIPTSFRPLQKNSLIYNTLVDDVIRFSHSVDRVAVMNLSGKVVYQQNNSGISFDLGNLDSGIYLIKAISGKDVITDRIIKVK